jgi:hypothetical protein
MYIRGSGFLSYNFLQFAIDGKNNSKTKVEKVFLFIFMSSYAEMSFLKQKNHQIGAKNFCWEIGRYGVTAKEHDFFGKSLKNRASCL